ncbi:hypothetical protein MSAN_00482900 [Mycena sanguinolenta]|uniref:Uncharacterized protein n=1 Tax=Mycena sanguinolenta TaxID=230812 RepID=A0A8H6Z8K1_9AGAR|nr:hypothetical protein MSAN_00482900 [Mycena sanguinolenta]
MMRTCSQRRSPPPPSTRTTSAFLRGRPAIVHNLFTAPLEGVKATTQPSPGSCELYDDPIELSCAVPYTLVSAALSSLVLDEYTYVHAILILFKQPRPTNLCLSLHHLVFLIFPSVKSQDAINCARFPVCHQSLVKQDVRTYCGSAPP